MAGTKTLFFSIKADTVEIEVLISLLRLYSNAYFYTGAVSFKAKSESMLETVLIKRKVKEYLTYFECIPLGCSVDIIGEKQAFSHVTYSETCLYISFRCCFK